MGYFYLLEIETIHWHTLAPKFLGQHSKVLDLGANYGMFARAITERFQCFCVAVEPSPEPFDAIPTTEKISKRQLAISDKPGRKRFHASEESLASSLTEGGSLYVAVNSLPNLVDELGWECVDLLKADIEGAEIDMLAACPDEFLSKRIAQISIEFHDFCGITSSAVVRQTLDRLHRLGFFSVRMSRVGHQDTWLINRNLLQASRMDLLAIRYISRNWFGLKRVLTRLLG